MKTSFKIFLIAMALMFMQSCGSKTEKNNDASVAKETPSMAENRAKMEKLTAERAERRRIQWEELSKTTPSYKEKDGNVVYNKAETEPAYNGGSKAMKQYLHDNIKYPSQAQENQLEGTVFVDFIITKTGNVREVSVADNTNENVDPSFRAEAIRVVTLMPNWLPGRQHGIAVDVKFSIPITFEYSDDDDPNTLILTPMIRS